MNFEFLDFRQALVILLLELGCSKLEVSDFMVYMFPELCAPYADQLLVFKAKKQLFQLMDWTLVRQFALKKLRTVRHGCFFQERFLLHLHLLEDFKGDLELIRMSLGLLGAGRTLDDVIHRELLFTALLAKDVAAA